MLHYVKYDKDIGLDNIEIVGGLEKRSSGKESLIID